MKLVLSGFVIKLCWEIYFALEYKVPTSLLRVKFYANIYNNIFTFSTEVVLFFMERLKTTAQRKQECLAPIAFSWL